MAAPSNGKQGLAHGVTGLQGSTTPVASEGTATGGKEFIGLASTTPVARRNDFATAISGWASTTPTSSAGKPLGRQILQAAVNPIARLVTLYRPIPQTFNPPIPPAAVTSKIDGTYRLRTAQRRRSWRISTRLAACVRSTGRPSANGTPRCFGLDEPVVDDHHGGRQEHVFAAPGAAPSL
jgi:hypothetical protein